MIDQRGPQSVQLVNGYRHRRPAGSWISARQSSQVARSAGRVGRGAVPARLGRMANPAASLPLRLVLAGDRLDLDGLDAGLRRMVVPQGIEKLVQRRRGPFGLDMDGAGAVLYPAGEIACPGGVVDERPEADPLDDAADGNGPTAMGGGLGRRRLHGGIWPVAKDSAALSIYPKCKRRGRLG